MRSHKRILIAGIGNIFLGDDAFGVELARELSGRDLPVEARVIDFGIRSYDLAYALSDGYDAAILLDATPRGGDPGTVYLIEPDVSEFHQLGGEIGNAHSMNPVSVLQMVQSMGGQPSRLYVVGCEPSVLETEEGQMGLSDSVREAVPRAAEMVESLVNDLLREDFLLEEMPAGAEGR